MANNGNTAKKVKQVSGVNGVSLQNSLKWCVFLNERPLKILPTRRHQTMPPTTTTDVGFWGNPTATIDWCENNYEVSSYIAEWWNTISNLMIILPPLWGMIEVFTQDFVKRFIFCNFLVLLVGVGSWCFHMTLLYEMQLLDELPMVYGSLFLVYCLYEAPNPANARFFSNKSLFIFEVAFALFFTVIYLAWPQPWFQHGSYGIIVFISFYLEGKIVQTKKCKLCKKLCIASISLLIFAFFLWNVDKIFCSKLHNFRQIATTGVGPFSQLHAWWHALAGYSSYLQLLFCIHTWYDHHKQKEKKGKLHLTHLGFSLRWS